MVTDDVAHVIDTDRYDLDDPGLIARVQEALADDGCSVLHDFVRPELQAQLQQEGADLADSAYYDVEQVNVYNTAPDPSLPADHPATVILERGNAFVARDQIPAEALIHRLYTDQRFQRFVAACVGLPQIHPLADPLAGLTLNVVQPGRAHPWHFDTNEFALSMLTQAPESGGEFEYCPGIRSEESENLADVRAVLDGEGGSRIRRLTLRPGSLQIFRGRYALHRVAPVGGDRPRHTAIFAYSARPGVIGTPERTRQLFGRLTPAHTSPRTGRVDALMD